MTLGITKERAIEIVLSALAGANDELAPEERFDVSAQTVLFGADAQIDSLTLVSLIVDVEQAVADGTGQVVTLTDERAMKRDPSPFRSADVLAEYIVELSNAG